MRVFYFPPAKLVLECYGTHRKKNWFTVILSESKHIYTMRFESIVSSFAYSCCSGSSVLSFDSNKMTWLLLLFTHYFFRCSNLSISSVSGEIRETMGIFIAVSWESNRFPERSAKKEQCFNFSELHLDLGKKSHQSRQIVQWIKCSSQLCNCVGCIKWWCVNTES